MKTMAPHLLFVLAASLLCGLLAYFFATPKIAAQNLAANQDGNQLPRTPTRCLTVLVFNTPCTMTFFDPDRENVDRAAREIVEELTQLHNVINAYDPQSELSRLNQTMPGTPMPCSKRLWDITLKAQQAWQISDHLFDATVGPLLHLWGFHARKDQLPTDEDISQARQKVGFQQVIMNPKQRSIAFRRQGMKLDFGGIAKGYALNLAATIAHRHQLKDFIIDLGGNIYCPQPSKQHPKPYRVGIKNPRKKDYIIGFVDLEGQCIATSGNYERQRIIQGRKIGHIMDPRTGRPAEVPQHYESVTAITADPTLSDVFSTTAFVGGPDAAEKLVQKYPRTAFVFVGFDETGNMSVTQVGETRLTLPQ